MQSQFGQAVAAPPLVWEGEAIVDVCASFAGDSPSTIQINVGETVLVVQLHESGWAFGRAKDGRSGYFPASCVQLELLGQQNTTALTTRSSADDASFGSSFRDGRTRTSLRANLSLTPTDRISKATFKSTDHSTGSIEKAKPEVLVKLVQLLAHEFSRQVASFNSALISLSYVCAYS